MLDRKYEEMPCSGERYNLLSYFSTPIQLSRTGETSFSSASLSRPDPPIVLDTGCYRPGICNALPPEPTPATAFVTTPRSASGLLRSLENALTSICGRRVCGYKATSRDKRSDLVSIPKHTPTLTPSTHDEPQASMQHVVISVAELEPASEATNIPSSDCEGGVRGDKEHGDTGAMV